MQTQLLPPIAILGAGSWGTALALYLSRRQQEVFIWSVDAQEIIEMQQNNCNLRYLPGFKFPPTLYPTLKLNNAIQQVQDIIIAVPSFGFQPTLLKLQNIIPTNARIICVSKGLDPTSGQFFSQLTTQILGNQHSFAVLSGPSFAHEVAKALPCAAMIATTDQEFGVDLTLRFNSPIFKTHHSTDVVGTEIGAIAKNVIAILTGISDGLQLGANTKSALITYGLAEIIRLGLVCGGKLETLIGLSGLGDLILTCTDDQSRNRRFGINLAQGKSQQDAESSIGQVVEGQRNAELLLLLAKKYNITLPICQICLNIIQGNLSAAAGIEQILNQATLFIHP